MQMLFFNLSKLATEVDSRLLALLVFLAFLLTLLAWKLSEGLAAVVFELVFRLTPNCRLAEKQRREAVAAEVDAIMAKINSMPARFQGPPKPPALWQVTLRRLAPVAFVALIGIWSSGAWHFYQRAADISARIAQDEAANPLLMSSLRGLNNDEPGKTYGVAMFLAFQVFAVLVGSAWQWYKTYRAEHQTLSGPNLPS